MFIAKLWVMMLVVLVKSDSYCGSYNCYELLGVSQRDDEAAIRKAYREMAKKYHPDKNRDDTTEYFQMINKAYEILTDQKSRFKYNLHLQNPTESEYYHEYRYYKHHYIQDPKIPPSVVIIGLLLVVSLLQYVMRKQMYERAIENISQSHDFRTKVNQRCGNNKKIKERVKQEMINQISIEGGYSRPNLKDMLICKIVLLPYHLFLWLKKQVRWIVKYNIKKEAYTRDDIVLLTVKTLKLTLSRWDMIDKKQQEQLLSRRLWEGKNMQEYQEQKRKEYMEQLKQDKPHQYAMMMKYMKKNQ